MLHGGAEINALEVVANAWRGGREPGGRGGGGLHDVSIADVLDIVDPKIFGGWDENVNSILMNKFMNVIIFKIYIGADDTQSFFHSPAT